MHTVDTSPWQLSATERVAAEQMHRFLATRFPLTTRERLREISATVTYARQLLIDHGAAIAPPGRVNVGSMLVSAIQRGRLNELATFAEHSRADEAELMQLRPTLLADLDAAEEILAQLTEALATISPPLATA